MLSMTGRRAAVTLAATGCALLALAGCSNTSAGALVPSSTTGPEHQSTISADSGSIYLVAPVGIFQKGWAELRNTPDGLRVQIDVSPSEAVAQPSHIHFGSCEQIGAIAYGLENVVGGRSTTVIPGVSIADVATGEMAINIHRSYSDFPTYTACGDIPALP